MIFFSEVLLYTKQNKNSQKVYLFKKMYARFFYSIYIYFFILCEKMSLNVKNSVFILEYTK